MAVLGNSTSNTTNLIRSTVFSDFVQEALRTPLLNDSFVMNVSDFGDGTTLHIPVIGDVTVRDRVEGQTAQFETIQDGVFNLTISQFKEAPSSLTKELLEDGYKGDFLMGRLASMQVDAIMKTYLADILATEDQQTASDQNLIGANGGAPHRFVAEAADDKVGINDFHEASYALQQSNIPGMGLVAIVHNRVLTDIARSANLTNLMNNPTFTGVVQTGMKQDEIMGLFDIGGFKVMQSNLLPTGKAETIDGDSITAGVANLFMSIANDMVKPIARAWRRQPEAQSEFDIDTDQWKFVTRARWGRGLLRPDGLVTVLGVIT